MPNSGITADFCHFLMEQALAQATLAAAANEVPVGAVVAHQGKVISSAYNLTDSTLAISAHAEILALNKAATLLGDWRLSECTLCVTLEPCTMCAGAIKLARIGTVIYGTNEPKTGAAGSLYDLLGDQRTGTPPRVIAGINQQRCSSILGEFFAKKR